MPLKPGKQNMGSNVHELMQSFMQNGSIGTSHPADKQAAMKQAVAIAYKQARAKK